MFTNRILRRLSPLLMVALAVGCQGPEEVSVAISLARVAVGTLHTQQFTAVVTGTDDQAVTWSVQEGEAGGSVDENGLYTAPATPGIYHLLVATHTTPVMKAKATITVAGAPPEESVTIDPANPQVRVGESVTFSAQVLGLTEPDPDTSVSWSVQESGGGEITADGVYTAPATPGEYHVVATSNANPDASAIARVEVLAPDPVVVTIADGPREVNTLETLQLQATVMNAQESGVTWSVKSGGVGGSIDAQSGLYTAPGMGGTDTVVATSVQDPTVSAEVVITVRAFVIEVSPSTSEIFTGQTLELTATVQNATNTAVDWSVLPDADAADGTLSAGSAPDTFVYTAPSTPGTDTVRVTSQHDPSRFAEATITVKAPFYDVTVSPAGPAAVNVAQTAQFSATVSFTPNAGVTWSVAPGGAGGTIDQTGLYTAPAVVGSGVDTVVATSNDDPAKTAEVQVMVTSMAQVEATPDTYEMVVGESLTLSATVTGALTQTVTWSVPSGGEPSPPPPT